MALLQLNAKFTFSGEDTLNCYFNILVTSFQLLMTVLVCVLWWLSQSEQSEYQDCLPI